MTALARAFRNAAPGKSISTRYTLTNHASDRIVQRVGIPSEDAEEWANKAIDGAVAASTRRRNNQVQHVYESGGYRLIVNEAQRVVITILTGVDTSFLEPIFDRERRKLQREITRKIRELELEQALILEDIAKHAINRARAKNPNTRELLQRKIDDLQTKVGEKDVEMERQRGRLKNFDKATQLYV